MSEITPELKQLINRIVKSELNDAVDVRIDQAFSDYEIKKSRAKFAAENKILDKHARLLDTALAVGAGVILGYLLWVFMRLAA